MRGINPFELKRNIIAWLEEDMPFGDITSDFIFEKESGYGEFVAKEDGVMCGSLLLPIIFGQIDPLIKINMFKNDGDWVNKKDILGTIEGPIGSILKGERVSLNLMQRLSGIATMAKAYSKEIQDLKTSIVDTRKTTPGLRSLEKYAVRVGGCVNHRFSLSDAVLIKDNHIAGAGSITRAVEKVRASIAHTVKVEVEVENMEEVKEAILSQVDIIMLDNMSVDLMRQAVLLIRQMNPYITIEASGNMRLDTIREVALTGVDIISVGALTHSVNALDISLKFKKSS